MDLVQGRSARQRNDFVLRLGCWMVTLSMVFSLVIQPPKAKAIVAEASLATSVIWAFMQSAGITFNGTGMNSSSWAESIEPYLREFTEATDSAAKSFWHWLGYENGAADFIKALSWSKITHPSTMPFPSVTIPPAVAKKLARFTVWFAEKVGLASGGNSQVVSYNPATNSIILPDGKSFYFSDTVFTNIAGEGIYLTGFSKGSGLSLFDFSDGKIYLTSTVCLCIEQNGEDIRLFLRFGNKSSYLTNFSHRFFDFTKPFYLGKGVNGGLCAVFETLPDSSYREKGYLYQGYELSFAKNEILFDDLFTVSKTQESRVTAVQPGALSPTYDDTEQKATIITIPGLDTEIAGINELLQAILDKLAANELTTSATIAQQPTPEQPDEEKPDLDGLGLPALGTALMTRFPFSIPWDVVRGIKLLAAPAEAPYWEVDFLAPIAGRVGGWKGSTKVVIDMEQYEIIGQLCRWTSTIGFCLVLAAGTKKLIWTA